MDRLLETFKELSQKSVNGIAQDLGVSQTTLNGQLSRGTVPISTLIAFCKRYEVSVIDVLLHAKAIDVLTARSWKDNRDLSLFSDLEIAKELYDRELTKELQRQKVGMAEKLAQEEECPAAPPNSDRMEDHIGQPTPDGEPFRPDEYQDHLYRWEKYGPAWKQSWYAIAAMDAERVYEQ